MLLQDQTSMISNMALSGLRENVVLAKIILTADGTIGCVRSDTWCHMLWHPLLVIDHIHTIVI